MSTHARQQQQFNYTTSQLPRNQREGSINHQNEEIPQRDYYEEQVREQRSGMSNRIGAIEHQSQHQQDTSMLTNTQELNTHAMARLLKESKVMRGRDGPRH